MNKLLVIVDMQNDFVTGSLANPDAEKIIPGIVELINKWDGETVATYDCHCKDYLNTQEGKRLPIEHCIDIEGKNIVEDIINALDSKGLKHRGYYSKETFGSIELGKFVAQGADGLYDEIYFCGTCTDICVISNAILCKSFVPETRIIVLKDLCAGTTKENHENALKAMAQCQIDIE